MLEIKPAEIYNLASVSQVSTSFLFPEEAIKVNLLPVIRMLELIRDKLPGTKFLQASSSEIFGQQASPPFDEQSIFCPLSPYAVSKEAACHFVKIYRKAYGLFASNAILFNHTSPYHSLSFVIPKLVKGLVEIKLGKINKIRLGNLKIERDWGFAGDYVKAMALMMEAKQPDDYVVGTGKHNPLKAIVEYIIKKLELDYKRVIEIDEGLYRVNDPEIIFSNPIKIMKKLGWQPEMNLEELIEFMIAEEMKKQGAK